MNINVRISPENAVRHNCAHGYQPIEIDPAVLKAAQRELLARLVTEVDGRLTLSRPAIDGDNCSIPYDVAAPSPEALIATLQDILDQIAGRAAEHEALVRRTIIEYEQSIRAWVEAPVSERIAVGSRGSVGVNAPYRCTSIPRGYVLPAPLCDQYARARDEAAAEATRLTDEVQARRAAEEEADEAAEAARDAEARTWIAAHGSSRLQRCVAEGIECSAVYRDERLRSEAPAWLWDTYDGLSTDQPRNPSEEALDLLDAARATYPDAVLRYGTYEWADEDEDENFEWHGYLCVARPAWADREAILTSPECPLGA